MKNPTRLCGNNEKAMFTVTFCCNAAGSYLPPFVVYKSQSMWDLWTKDGPENCQYTSSSSGWMESETFINWFKFFIKSTDSTGKLWFMFHLILNIFKFYFIDKILFLDGHNSHISVEIINLAIENICLIPHTTHVLQSLDVSVFKPVKSGWKSIIHEYYLNSGFDNIT